MLYQIENEELICTIESSGAEIRSLRHKATGKEYIWQIDPKVWGSSSPILFPAIGTIKDDHIRYKGKSYAMPKHGIIRNNDELRYTPHGTTKCSFTLDSSERTLKQYPFRFTFTVVYELIDTRLTMTYRVENRDSVPMHFACGGHTAYACPVDDITALSDYVIEFPHAMDLRSESLNESLLLSYRKRKIESKDGLLELSDTLFNEDALIFTDIPCDHIRLRKRQDKKGVTIRFEGYPHLALWAKPGADYVCIEPWLGLPDREDESLDISEKSTYMTLAPKAEFSISIETEVE